MIDSVKIRIEYYYISGCLYWPIVPLVFCEAYIQKVSLKNRETQSMIGHVIFYLFDE